MNILEFVMGVDSKPFVTGVERGKAALNAAFKSIEGIGEGFKTIF